MNDQQLTDLETELGQHIQALEAAALGQDPDALLTVARDLETAVQALDQAGLDELSADTAGERERVEAALHRLQRDMRRTFSVVAQRREQTGAALRALGTGRDDSPYGQRGARAPIAGRALGQA
ncbi:hypothetical protein [Abyssibacter profundi]|uniref:Uncharacterized protein n=1 Tax=Abyssibacter profundi TaxID=2182787 RepID=A0A383XQ92_9GAMM|nr:hypothetical protein [Abyssibacter profundi]MBV60321.1 hypothetical protein [Nevskiales bacterium]PWN54796.1 hypothetical protein DEH80_15770 [Abyssibacter profundi]